MVSVKVEFSHLRRTKHVFLSHGIEVQGPPNTIEKSRILKKSPEGSFCFLWPIWRHGAKKRELITSRSFPREIPVLRRFWASRFQPLSVRRFFSNQEESISWCPKSPFPSQIQNWQIARTSSVHIIVRYRWRLEIDWLTF